MENELKCLELYASSPDGLELLGDVTLMDNKSISEIIFEDLVTYQEKLNGNALIYRYHNKTTKSRLLDTAKFLDGLKPVLKFTALRGEIDNSLAVTISSPNRDYNKKWEMVSNGLSNGAIDGIVEMETKFRKDIAKWSVELHDKGISADIVPTLYIKGMSKFIKEMGTNGASRVDAETENVENNS